MTPVRPHRRPAPDPGDGAQVHRGRDHARSPPSGTRSTSSRATRSARRPSSASARSTVSEESGGIGLGRLEAALIMEAMAYGCPSTSAFISIHNMASWMIDRFGVGTRSRQKYLPSMITMERIGSYCLTEPSSGSDAAALKTKAVLDGDHYVVSRLQGVHLGRRRERNLRDHGPHRRGRPEGHHRAGDREGHAGRQLRRPGEEARLAFAADRPGQFRRGARAGRQPRRRARAKASASR